MKRLIYYPTLEPHDINWLKYALIYIDNFSPIIPRSVEGETSDTFKLITDTTDLISIHNPTYNQGDRASTKTLIELRNIQGSPNQYRDKFNVSNIERVIENPDNWNYKLYEQKFNMDFRHEIVDRKLGKSVDNGILTSKELGNLFMIFLSEEVAKDERGNPVTDITEYDNLTTYLRDIESQQHTEQDDFVKTVLDLTLPEKIETIPLEKIIEFRNSSEILELRKKLNLNITKFYNLLEHGNDPSQYIDYIGINSTELTKEISLFFGGAAAFSLGASSILSNPLSLESLKSIIEGTILSVTGISAINSAWSKNADKRAARKFLTKLNRI